MFRLVRHFSVVSAAAIVVVVAGLMLFFRHLSVEDMITLGERQNTFLSHALINEIRMHEGDDFAWITDPGREQSRAIIDRLTGQVRDLPVLRVGILDRDGRMVVAAPAGGGEGSHRAGSRFLAALDGRVASRRVADGDSGGEILSTYVPVHDEAGALVGAMLIETDVSSLLRDIDKHVLHVFVALLIAFSLLYLLLYRLIKQADRTIREQHAKLEQNTEDLFEALVSAKEADATKSKFLATVSHELRTPLTSIMGTLKLMRGGAIGPVPAEIASMIDIASRNSDRLAVLIEDVLDITKIESGKLSLNLTPIAVSDLVERAVEAHRMIGQDKGVAFAVRTPLPSSRVEGDADRLMQVFANLLSNAVKFSPQGATVEIGAVDTGDRVRFSVEDHGSGIPEAFRDRVFFRFTQADGSDERASGGLGLGLSITRAIVELHGGSIGFETKTGEGTTFHFELPVLHDDAKAGEIETGDTVDSDRVARAANAE